MPKEKRNPLSGSKAFPKENNFIIVLMNITVFPLLVIMTVFGILISFPALLVFKTTARMETFRIIRLFVWIYGRGWLAIIKPFTRLQAEGLNIRDINTPCIIVPNHLSFFDTFFMGALPFSNVCFAIRSWPFRMAWYNPFMRLARYLDVEGTPWEESFERCRNELLKGAVLLFFPEAHRSRDGSLGRFYSGAFKVSVATGVPIIPLCITGTGDMYPPGKWLLKPAKVRLKALPAVNPDRFQGPNSHMEMRRVVKTLMAEEIERMR